MAVQICALLGLVVAVAFLCTAGVYAIMDLVQRKSKP